MLAYCGRNLSTEEKGKIATKFYRGEHQLKKRGYRLVCLCLLRHWTQQQKLTGAAYLFSNCPSQIRHRGGLLAELTFKKSGQNSSGAEPAWTSQKKKKIPVITSSGLYSQHILRRKFLYCSCALVKKIVTLICLILLAILPSERLLSYTTELCKSYEDGHVLWILLFKLQKKRKSEIKIKRKNFSGHTEHNLFDNMLW